MTRLLWDDEDPENFSASQSASNRPKSKPVQPIAGSTPENPLSISALNTRVKQAIDSQLSSVWLEGEVCDLSRPSSGHYYFTLKDSQSQIRAVMWRSSVARLAFRLEDGQSLLCQGQIDVYLPRGTYQLTIQRAQPKGLGPLQIAFRQLHEKLAREGLFQPERKKALPRFPRRIGFVTSPSGAAVHDFLEVLRRRWPNVHVIIIPAKVQGAGSAHDIVRGIFLAENLVPKLDVLVVGRGGGSLEDLWTFNEEPVVRAVAASVLPTISAVGHEVDVTLCDLAADARALTPSEAAERVLPNAFELHALLLQTQTRITAMMESQLRRHRKLLDTVARRGIIDNPKELLRRVMQRVDELELRCQLAIQNQVAWNQQRLDHQATALDALSPLRVIQRGYSVTRSRSTKKTVLGIDSVQVGDTLETLLSDGSVVSRVEAIDAVPPLPDLT